MLVYRYRHRVRSASLILLNILACLHIGVGDTLSGHHRHHDRGLIANEAVLANNQDAIGFSTTWQMLGPFRIGTRGKYDEVTRSEAPINPSIPLPQSQRGVPTH